MIGKIIGAFAGSKVAGASRNMGGPMGAAIGVVAASAVKRLSVPALVALTAGGYLVKKLMDKQEAGQTPQGEGATAAEAAQPDTPAPQRPPEPVKL